MAAILNRAAFDDPRSRQAAEGVDHDRNRAIVDSRGNVLAYAQTGGMLAPNRIVVERGATIFRFGASGRAPQAVAAGAWWVERSQFEKLLSFAQTHELAIGMAVRLLCLVPPEWSDIGTLVRARLSGDLLAWRGLGASVVIAPQAGRSAVRLPHHNDIAARRLFQLFIPGLGAPGAAQGAVRIENCYPLSVDDGLKGFLYL